LAKSVTSVDSYVVQALQLALQSDPLPTETDSQDHPNSSSSSTQSSEALTWFTRKAVLKFITPVRAHALMLLNKAQNATLQSIVEERLLDKQLEVASVASATLIGFYLSLSTAKQAELAEKYLLQAAGKLPKKIGIPVSFSTATKEELDTYQTYKQKLSTQLKKKFAGVLGMCAIIKSHPFDVPQFLPKAIARFAYHSNDPAPINSSVRDTLEEFKRTHGYGSNDWVRHSAMFTSDQLSDLESASVGTKTMYL
jgi:proteasome activator subunit 4